MWWKWLAPYGLAERRSFLTIVVLTLLGVGLSALAPWPLKLIVDHVIGEEAVPRYLHGFESLLLGSPTQSLVVLSATTVLLFVAAEAVKIASTYVQRGVGERMMYALAADTFERIQRLSLRYHERQQAGDLVRRVTSDTQCVRDLLLGVGVPLLTSTATLLVFFAVMWSLNSTLTLIALLAALPLPWLLRRLEPRMADSVYAHEKAEGQVMALAEQTLSSMPVVQGFDTRAAEVERFRTSTQRSLSAYLHSIVVELQFKIGVSTSTAIGTAVMLALGGFQVLEGNLTIGGLLVFIAYLSSLYGPVETLANLGASYAAAVGRARRVHEVYACDDEIADGGSHIFSASVRDRQWGNVEFDSLTVGYGTGEAVLSGVNLSVQAGETVALVGHTGSGKTTLVSLIPRFIEPWSGRVLLHGRDVRDVRLSSLRAQIGLVPQSPFLLPLSVAENIAYGRPDADRDEIVNASKAACAHEFIERLPQGYDTVLGERGATLSGGQGQRLAIARALLVDPPVLILDEPTSSLDAETEGLLLSAIQHLIKGRTTFVVAHRLTTTRLAERIVVLDKGGIVESGSHAELADSNGAYAQLFRAQFETG